VAALGQVDVAVPVTLPVARGLTGNDGRKQVGGDAVAGCGGVDGALRVGERPARNRPGVGAGAAPALATESDTAVVLVPGGEVLAVLREEAVSRVLVAAPVERGTSKPTRPHAGDRGHGGHGQRLERAVCRRAQRAGGVDGREPDAVHVRRVRGVASVAAPAGPAAGHQSPAAVAVPSVASRRAAAGWAA